MRFLASSAKSRTVCRPVLISGAPSPLRFDQIPTKSKPEAIKRLVQTPQTSYRSSPVPLPSRTGEAMESNPVNRTAVIGFRCGNDFHKREETKCRVLLVFLSLRLPPHPSSVLLILCGRGSPNDETVPDRIPNYLPLFKIVSLFSSLIRKCGTLQTDQTT